MGISETQLACQPSKVGNLTSGKRSCLKLYRWRLRGGSGKACRCELSPREPCKGGKELLIVVYAISPSTSIEEVVNRVRRGRGIL